MMTFTSKERLELLPEEMRVWFARFYERRRLFRFTISRTF